jgi:hypothetical protein
MVSTDDIDRGRCMAAALRDRTPGQTFFAAEYGLIGWHAHAIEIVGELGVLRDSVVDDFFAEYHERVDMLLPPADFEECAVGPATHECVAGLDCPG